MEVTVNFREEVVCPDKKSSEIHHPDARIQEDSSYGLSQTYSPVSSNDSNNSGGENSDSEQQQFVPMEVKNNDVITCTSYSADWSSSSLSPGNLRPIPAEDFIEATSGNWMGLTENREAGQPDLTENSNGSNGDESPEINFSPITFSQTSTKNSPLDGKRVFCAMCQETVSPGGIHAHVIFSHLDEQGVSCGYCSYSSKWNYAKVKNHVEMEHEGRPLKIYDVRMNLKKKVRLFVRQCFPAKIPSPSTTGGSLTESNSSQTFLTESNSSQTLSAKRVIERVVGDNSTSSDLAKRAIEQVVEDVAQMDTVHHETRKRKILPTPGGDPRLGCQIHGSRSQCKWCELCERFVCGGNLRRHVLANHLMKQVLFCPHCNHSNKGEESRMRAHIAGRHPGMAATFNDRRSDYGEEITDLLFQCFPNYTPRGMLGEVEEGGSREEKASGSSEFSGEEAVEKSRTYKKHCKICKVWVHGANKQRHILLNHLKKPVYFCPYCTYNNMGVKRNLILHITGWHPGEEIQIIDKMSCFKQEIAKITMECFSQRDAMYFAAKRLKEERKHCEMDEGDLTIKKVVIDTKMKILHKVKCNLCAKWCGQNRLRHILGQHLKETVYFCPYCDYGTNLQRDGIKKHVLMKHPNEKCEIIDKVKCFEKEIEALRVACFDGAECETFEPHFTPEDLAKRRKKVRSSNWHKIGKDDQDPLGQNGSPTVEEEVRSLALRCRLCDYVSTSDSKWQRVNHVQNKHLKRKIYFCPLCEYSDFAKRVYLFEKHFEKVHPNEKLEIVDRYEESRMEIEKMVLECFSKKKQPKHKPNKGYLQNKMQSLLPNGEEGRFLFCKKCEKEISSANLEKHIYQIHMKKVCVRCPYCDFGSLYDPRQVECHVRAVHPDKDVRVVDNRGDVSEEFQAVRMELFSF